MKHAHVLPLESRKLMSATPAEMGISTVVQSDRITARADLTAFKADVMAATAQGLTDVAAAVSDHLMADHALRPAVTKLRRDFRNIQATYRADRLGDSGAIMKYEAAVTSDLTHQAMDAKGPTAAAADAALLVLHERLLLSAMANGLYMAADARAATASTIFGDSSTITSAGTAPASDPRVLAVSPATTRLLEADLVHLSTDADAATVKLNADVQRLVADRQQLATDVMVELGLPRLAMHARTHAHTA